MIESGFIGTLDEIWQACGNQGFFFCRLAGNDQWRYTIYVKYQNKIGDRRSRGQLGDFYYIVDLCEVGRIREKNLHYQFGNKIHIFLGPEK